MSTLGEAMVPIRATMDKLDGDLSAARSKIEGVMGAVGQNVQRLGAAALTGVAAVGAGVAGAMGAAFAASSDFQNATNAIIVGTGASGDALAEMQGIAKGFRGSVIGLGHDSETIGGAIAEVNTRLGLTGDELESVSGQILQYSRLTGGDAVKQTQLLTRAMGDWGIENENAGGLLDQLFGAGQAFGIGVDDLAAKVVQFGAPMRQMGFDLETTIALFGKWEKEGVNAELAIGSLRIAAGKFARENVPLEEGLRDTMESIKGATSESEALAIAMDVFGARAGPDMAAAIREGRFELDEAIEALRATEGGLADAAERTITLGDRWEVFKNRASTALIPVGDLIMGIGERFMPVLEGAFERLEPVIETISGVLRSLFNNLDEGMLPLDAFIEAIWDIAPPELLDALIQFRDEILPGFMEKLQSLWETVQPVIARIAELATEFITWKDVAIGLAIAIGAVVIPIIWAILSPILAVIAVGALLVAAVALIRTAWESNWGGIQEKTAAVTGWLRTNIPAAIEAVRQFVANTLTAIQNFWATHGDTIIATAEKAWATIQKAIDTVLSIIEDLWAAWQSAREGDWRAFGENLRAAADKAWEAIKNVFNTAKEALLKVVNNLIDDAKASFNDTDWGQLARNIIDGLVNGLSGAAGRVADKLREVAQNAWDAWQGFWNSSSPSRRAMDGVKDIRDGLVIQFQRSENDVMRAVTGLAGAMDGGLFDRGAALAVGAPGAASGVTYHFDFRGANVSDGDDLERRIERVLARQGIEADQRRRTQ